MTVSVFQRVIVYLYIFVLSWKSITDHLLTHEKTMFKDLMSKL